jgi:hypothetical protein
MNEEFHDDLRAETPAAAYDFNALGASVALYEGPVGSPSVRPDACGGEQQLDEGQI